MPFTWTGPQNNTQVKRPSDNTEFAPYPQEPELLEPPEPVVGVYENPIQSQAWTKYYPGETPGTWGNADKINPTAEDLWGSQGGYAPPTYETYQTANPPARYWTPQRVVQHYNTLKQLDYVPEWYDKTSQDSAYKMLQLHNQGKSWVDWTVDETDTELVNFLDKANVPPVEAMADFDKDKFKDRAWQSMPPQPPQSPQSPTTEPNFLEKLQAGTIGAGHWTNNSGNWSYVPEGMTDEKWNKLDFLQKVMNYKTLPYQMFNSVLWLGMGAAVAGGISVATAGTGLPIGLAAGGTIAGAGILGQTGALGPQVQGTTQVLGQLADSFAIATEMALGSIEIADVVAKDYIKGDLKSLGEVMETLNAISPLYYESIGVAARGLAVDWKKPPLETWHEGTPGVVASEPINVGPGTGYYRWGEVAGGVMDMIYADYKAARTPQERMELNAKWIDKLGMYGELGDFFHQMILDPGGALTGIVGKSFSNKAGMGKLAASTENPQIIAAVNSVDGEMAKLAAFRVTAESTPITEVAKYSPIARKLAGVKQGADGAWLWVKEQPQSNKGLGFLVNHTPVSRAMSMLKNSYDVLGSWAIGKTPEELFGELATIAKLTPEELQNSIEVMPQKLGGRAVYEALKLSADKLSSLYTVTWAGQNSNRQLLTGISEALNIPFITVQDSLIKDGVGDKYLTDLKAIKDLPNNLKEYVQKPGVNGDTLKMAANSFKTSKAAISVDVYRGEVLNTVLKDIESVVAGKEWANVTPETNLVVRWGKFFKNVQGLLSLDSNPIYVLGNMWGDFFSFNHHLGTLSIFTDTEKVFKNLGFAPLIQSFGDSLGVESNITVSDRFGEIIKAASKSPNDTLYKLNDLVSNIRSRNFLSLQNIVKGLERGLSEKAVAAGVLQYIKGNPVNIPVTPELISFLSGVGIDPVYLQKIVENTSITDLTELMHYQPPAIKFRELVTFASPEIQAELDGRIEKITGDARKYDLSPEEVKDQIADLIGEYIIKDAEENYVKAVNNEPVVREKISEACKAEGVTLAILRVLDELNVEELSTRNLHVNSISSIWHLRVKDRTAILNAESSRFRTARAIRMQKYMALAQEVVGDNSASEGFAKVINTTLEIDARWDDFYTKRNRLWRDLYNFNRDDRATNRVLTVARSQFNMSEKYLNSKYQIDLDWKRVYTEEITKMLNNNYLEIMEIDKKQISELDDFVARLTNYDPTINKNRAERTGVREIMLGAMIYFRSGDSTILDNAENRELGEQVKNHVSAIAGEGRQFGSVDKTTGQVRQQYWRKFQSIMTSLDIMYSQLSLYAPSGTSTSLIQGQINAEYSRILEKYKKELEAREKIKDWNIWKAAGEQGILTATSTGVPTNTHLWNMLMKYAKDIILQTVVIPTKLTYSIREEILSQVTQEVFDVAIEKRNNEDILDVKNQKPQLYNSLQLYEKEMIELRHAGGVVDGEYARILEELRVIFKESNKAEACLALVKIAMRNAAVNAQNRGIRKSEAQFAKEFSVTNEESNVAELRNLQDPEQLMFSIIASHPGVKDTVGKFTTDGGNTLARNSFWSSSSKDKVFGEKVFYYSDERSGKAPQKAILRMANPWDMDAVVRAEQWEFLVKHKFVERTQFQGRATTEYKLSDDAKLRLAKLLQAGNGGYDGIIQKVGNRTDYIIFSESQTFGLGTRSLSQTDGKPLFFSPLREGISGFKSVPKTGAQWLKALGKMANIPNTRPQVEMRDRGFDTWLEERRNTVVTQEEVQEFLDSTEIEMVETEIGPSSEVYTIPMYSDYSVQGLQDREYSELILGDKNISYTSAHFSDIPNYLMHVRYQTATIEGKKMLVVDEIQSDVFQDIKHLIKGKNITSLTEEMPHGFVVLWVQDKFLVFGGETENNHHKFFESEQEVLDYINNTGKKVPSTVPFKDNWSRVAIKRLLAEAVKKGAEGIVIVPGSVQAGRYVVPSATKIRVQPLYYVVDNNAIANVRDTPVPLAEALAAKTENQRIVESPSGRIESQGITYHRVASNYLEKFVGIPLAKQILATTPDADGWFSSTPEMFQTDPRIKPMEAFYDVSVIKTLKALLGTDPSQIKLTEEVPAANSFIFTPENKQSISNGQALYAKTGNITFADEDKVIVGIFRGGDVNTIVHEVIGHYCTHHLSEEHGNILTSWIKQMHSKQYAEVMSRFDDPNADPGEWWRAQDKSLFRSWHELVATASETYMRSTNTSFTGFAAEIKVFLTLLREWMNDIYKLVNRHYQVNLTPEVRRVFDDILKIGTTEIADPLPGVTLKEVQARQEAYFATSVLDSYLDEHLPDILKECPTFYREVVQRYEEDAVRDGTMVNIRYAVRDVTERNDTDYRITHRLPPGVDAYSPSISEVIQGIDEFVRYLSYSDYALDPKTVKVEGKYIQYQVMKIGKRRTGVVNNGRIWHKNDQRVINMAYFPVMGEYLREYKLGVALNYSPELIVYKLQNTVVKAKGKLTLDYKSDPRTTAIFRDYAVPALEEIMNSVGYTISKNISWKDGVLTIQGMAIPDWVAPTDMEGSIPDEVRPVVNVDVANVTVKDSLMFNYKERMEIMEKISKLQGKLGLKRTLKRNLRPPIWEIFPGEIDTQAEYMGRIDTQAEYMGRINEGQKRNLPEYTPSIEESPEHIMPPYNIPTSKPEKEFAGEIIPQIEDTSCPLMRKLMEKYGHPNINYALQVIRQDMVRSTEEDHHYIMPYNPKDKQGTDILIQALQEVADSTVYTTSDGIKYEFTFRLNDVKEHPRSARPYSYLGPFLEITITKKLPKLTTQVAEPIVTFDDDGYAIFTEEHLEWIDSGDPARIGELIAIYGKEAVDFEMMVSKEFNQQGNLPDASVLNQGEETRLSRDEIRKRKREENINVQKNNLPDSAGIRGEPPASDEAKPDSVKEQPIEPMYTSAVPKEEGADDSGLANRSKKTPMQATPGFFPLPNEITPKQATPGVLPPLPVEEINNEITEKDAFSMDEALISLNPTDLKLQGPLIDELREKILAKDPTANIDEIMAKISEQLQVYMDKAKNIKRDHKLAAIRWGEHVRDVSLLNYADSRGMDNYLMAIFPYEYWYTRSGINWMTYFIDHPNYALRTARLARFLKDEYEEEGFPEKLKGKMRIDIPFLPKELGGSIYVDPIRMPFPWLQALEGVTTILRDARIEEKRIIRAIEDRARAEDITEEEAKQAIENKQGKIWEEAKNGLKIESGDISSFPNTVSKILAPSIFAKSALTALQGGNPAKDISQFPGSRAVQTLTGVAEAGGIGRGFIPPGGWNIEDYAREMLGNTGIPKINKTQDNAIDALISAMVSEGKATLQEGRDAMVNRKGKLYDEALRRQAVYGGLKYAGSLLGLNPALFSDGEKRGMEASKALEAAYKLEAKGPKGAVEAFWKKYPDYALKARIMDKDPEYRIRKFVIADLHNTFKDMETINKKAFTDKAGREFVDGFLDSGTRNYDNIKTDTLIMWSQAMKGYVPEKAEVPTLSIDYAPDDIAKAAQQYYDMKKKWGMSPYQQMMTDLKTDEERNAFIRQIPNYRNYQRWNNKQLANMDPKVIPWVTNENSELYGVDPVVQKMVYQYRDEREKYEWEDTTSPKYNEYMRWKNETLATNPSIIPYVVGNTSPMYGFPVELQQYVYAYRAMRDKNFPNYLQWQDEYFAKTNKKERMAYLATHKRLTDYWTFRDKAASDYPQAAAFVKSEESLRGDILGYNYPTASEYNSFSDILNEFSPELRQQTLEYKYSGTPLGTGGTNQLARIADNYNVSVEDVLKYVNSQ